MRIGFLLQSACWSSIFGYIENKRFRKKIEATATPKSPIFIIGHWRTGSTLLHQIMRLDPAMITPSLFQVAEPDCFLTSYNYYKPIMNLLLRKNRPMDQVKLGMDEPQEDEYAIFRLTLHSPLERLVFPASNNYFLRDYPSFVPEAPEKLRWESQILHFFKKLSYGNQKTIVSKNPFNSLRIQELLSLFPDARFIHIYRHPFEVVPSTVHLWKIVHEQNCLNDKGSVPTQDDVIDYLDYFWNVIKQDMKSIPEGKCFSMKFEELEADPENAIKQLYTAFNIPYSTSLGKSLKTFLAELQNYSKNQYLLTEDEQKRIHSRLKNHIEYFGYS